MGIMRINRAHDAPRSASGWSRTCVARERYAGLRCLASFDLAGPKLRTGPMAPGPAVVKWRPVRHAMGRVTELARVRFVARIHAARRR